MIPQNIQTISMLQKVFQEGFNVYNAINANKILEQKKSELQNFITQVNKLLKDIEEIQRQEGQYMGEQKKLIDECKDKLDKSDKLLKRLPSKLNIIEGYQYVKGDLFKEVQDCLNEMNEYRTKIDDLLKKSIEQGKTVIPQKKQPYIQYIYKLQIKLSLKAPREIQSIFDENPFHLKSEYQFEIIMEDAGSSRQNIYTFKRDDFNKLYKIEREFQLQTMSKLNHCTLQIRNQLEIKPKKKVCPVSDQETPTPNSNINSKKDEDDFSHKFKLYLIVGGKNGVTIIRKEEGIIHIGLEQELELLKNDQIVFFQDSRQNPQVSYIVQQIQIEQK